MRKKLYWLWSILPLAILIAAIRPFADVMYGGDDWGYAWSARELAAGRGVRISDWASAAAYPQIVWGGTMARIAGFSLTALNVANILAAILGGIALYLLLRRVRATPPVAAFFAAVLTGSPLYVGLAASYMSDLTYAVLMTAALLAGVVALQKRNAAIACVTGLLMSAAFLSRQIGLVLIIAWTLAGVLLVLQARDDRRRAAATVGAGIAVGLGVFLLYQARPELFGGRSLAQSVMLDPRSVVLGLLNAPRMVVHMLLLWNYIVILLAPAVVIALLVAFRGGLLQGKARVATGALALAIAAFAILWWRRDGTFVVRGDMFQIGPRYGTEGRGTDLLWGALVVLAIIPGAALLTATAVQVAKRRREIASSGAGPFLILALLGHLALTTGFISFYNNYFLPVLILTLVVMVMLFPTERIPKPAVVVAALLMIWSFVSGERNARYQEAAWRVSDEVAARAGSSEVVFGPPSWYGWRNYDAVIADIRSAMAAGAGVASFNVLGHARDSAAVVVVGSRSSDVMAAPAAVDSVSYATALGLRQVFAVSRARR